MAKRGNPNLYPGCKGLPGAGQKKKRPEIDAFEKKQTLPAYKILVEIMNNPDTVAATRVDIAKYLINRTEGCPTQSMADEQGNAYGIVKLVELPKKDGDNEEEK